MKNNIVYIGVDPGNQGGITIIDGKSINMFEMPIIVEKKGKKTKTSYDLCKIVDILSIYKDKKVVYALERVSCRPGEGGVSSFHFGIGFGILQGIAIVFGFDLTIISPQIWKKSFPQLTTTEMDDLKEQNKDLRQKNKTFDIELKDLKSKNRKEKDKDQKKLNKSKIDELKSQQKDNKKEIDRNLRKIKSVAKDNARFLAADLLPDNSDRFKRKKDDGVAESYLIALHIKNEAVNELV
jgi:hypothetical protein